MACSQAGVAYLHVQPSQPSKSFRGKFALQSAENGNVQALEHQDLWTGIRPHERMLGLILLIGLSRSMWGERTPIQAWEPRLETGVLLPEALN